MTTAVGNADVANERGDADCASLVVLLWLLSFNVTPYESFLVGYPTSSLENARSRRKAARRQVLDDDEGGLAEISTHLPSDRLSVTVTPRSEATSWW